MTSAPDLPSRGLVPGGKDQLQTLVQSLDDRARTHADSVFITTPAEGDVTYAEFARRTEVAAHQLRTRGVVGGDTVALMSALGVDAIAIMFGAYRLGAVLAMVNPALSPREIGVILDKSHAMLFVGGEDIGGDDGVTRTPAAEVVAETAGFEPVGRADTLDGGATMVFTSGTTAAPKAVVYSHGHQAHGARVYIRNLGLSDADTFMLQFPLFHMNGLNQFGAALVSGARILLVERFRSSTFDELVREFRPTSTFLNATHIKMIRSVSPEGDGVDSLERVGTSLQMVLDDYEWFESKYGALLIEGYGQTESITICLSNPLSGNRKRQSCGVPVPGYAAKLVNESGEECGPAEIGQLLVKTTEKYGLFWEYFEDPDTTSRTLVDGWLHTGDLLHRDEDGYFYFVEREKDIIKRAGENISASEVQEVIEQLSSVDEAAVVGKPDRLREEVPIAYVTVVPGREVTTEMVIEHCRSRLAAYKVPEEVVVLDQFPRTAVGKIEKRALRQLAQSRIEEG